jgi:hypothetical protein
MQTISLKSNSSDIAIPLLKNAIDREKRILMETLRITREKINRMAEQLGVNIDKLMRGEVEHSEAQDMQLIELEGEIEISKHIEAELKELESVEICK